MTETNRRAFRRFSTRFALCIITHRATVPAEPLELSEGGLSCRSSEALEVGEQIAVEFKLEDAREWIRVKCAVRHTAHGPRGRRIPQPPPAGPPQDHRRDRGNNTVNNSRSPALSMPLI
jgi:hypothetical protein